MSYRDMDDLGSKIDKLMEENEKLRKSNINLSNQINSCKNELGNYYRKYRWEQLWVAPTIFICVAFILAPFSYIFYIYYQKLYKYNF